MTNTPIGIPSGWEEIAALYWANRGSLFHLLGLHSGRDKWLNSCRMIGTYDWRVIE